MAIRRIRRSREWTEAQVAKIIGMSGVELNDLERGLKRISPEVLRRVAHGLGVTVTDILRAADEDDTPA